MRSRIALAALGVFALAACGDDPERESTETSAASTSASETVVSSEPVAGRCLVRLHGKGGTGGEATEADGITVLAPTGNADGWGARQWLYFPEEQFSAATAIVAEAVEPCQQVIVNGFSNGGAFTAKLFCQGETFGGRLVGVVIDDPVVDGSVEGCDPDPAVDVTLYWTGALESTAQPGWNCADGDWTCEGGTTIGIDAFAAALATDVIESPNDTHEWYVDAPETLAF